MLQKLLNKKWHLCFLALIILFVCISFFSFVFIDQINNHSLFVTNISTFRTNCQRLIKQELTNHPNLQLEQQLEQLINEINDSYSKVFTHTITVHNVEPMIQKWHLLRQVMRQLRLQHQAEDQEKLYTISEELYDLADNVFNAVKIDTAQHINQFFQYQMLLNILFLILIILLLIYAIRNFFFKKHSQALNRMAYFDLMTGLPNRTSCNNMINTYEKNKPAENLAVFMLDMNNLKPVNDQLGHQAGDQVIIAFATIIRDQLQPYGFVCRYGGDEFLAILPDMTVTQAEQLIANIHQSTLRHNAAQTNPLKKLSFAAGYYINNLGNVSLTDMIYLADQQMYINKRQVKKAMTENQS